MADAHDPSPRADDDGRAADAARVEAAAAARVAEAGRAVADSGALASTLVDALPAAPVELDGLGRWLGEAAMSASQREAVALNGLQTADLVLAWRAAHVDDEATAEVHRRAEEAASRVHRSLLAQADASDLVQKVSLRLLEDPSALLSYGGRGSLVGWLRVILTREALALRKRAQRAAPLPDDDLFELPGFSETPELQAAKSEHRELVQRAIRDALGALAPDEADALRRFHLAGATLDELAAEEGVHRATISKRLRKIRERLLKDATARVQAEQSRLSQGALRFVMSQLEVSIERALGHVDDDEGGSV